MRERGIPKAATGPLFTTRDVFDPKPLSAAHTEYHTFRRCSEQYRTFPAWPLTFIGVRCQHG